MKRILVTLLFTLLIMQAYSESNVTCFGEKDYNQLLDKYFQKIEEGTFTCAELEEEINGIRSNYVIALVTDIVSKLKVKRFFRHQEKSFSNELIAAKELKAKLNRDTPTITTVEFSPTSVTQYTARRGYIAAPYHYPMSNWYYDWTSVEPFMLGIVGSKEDSSLNWHHDKAYSTWYRLYLTFDLTSLTYPMNITSAYIKIEHCNYFWGKDELGGMSSAFVTSSDISTFYDLDTFGMLAEATMKPYGYGSSNERLVFSPLEGVIPYFMDSYAHGMVLNFKQLDTSDHGNWFYAKRIWKRNIKLVIKYET